MLYRGHLAGMNQDQAGNHRHQQRQQRRQRVQHQLDPDRSFPPPQDVGYRSAGNHPEQPETRNGNGRQNRGHRHRVGGPRSPEADQGDDKGGNEKGERDQQGQVGFDHPIRFNNVSSSRVLYRRKMLMSSAKPTPVVATLTTMAVSIKVCGNGLM